MLNFNKNNMKNFNSLYILLAAVTLQSCTKDLDVVSKDQRVQSADVIFSTPEGYKQALAGVYGNLSLTGTGDATTSFLKGIDAGTSQFGRCLWYLQDLTTDEVVWSYENDKGTAELQRNTWTSSNDLILGMFSRTMAEVAIGNDFLRQSSPEKLTSRGFSAAETASINTYRQEVRALRAFAYYNMMDLFGKAPFITEADPINFQSPQYNRQQLFTFIESELKAIMPDLKVARTNEYGRVDQGFAKMILAKMYLNAAVYTGTAKYAECMTMCSDIIGSGYTLKPNYLDNFKADNNTSNEMIFTLQSDGLRTQNYGATTVMCNGQVGSTENNGSEFGVGGWGGALRLRKQFVQKFDGSDFNTDTRKTIRSGSRDIEIQNIALQGQGYILGKYSNISSTGVKGVNSTFVDTDFPLFRLGDVYLMYAEAQMRKDGATNGSVTTNATALSIGYLNALRERANKGATTANLSQSNVTLNFILDERARELHWEAHRRQDLIRFEKYTGGSYNWAWKGNIAGGTSISDNLKVFPLPAASLAANPNLTQNSGY
jgi:starch-binding outer membrane protein, SusD/RagB family